MLDFKRVEAEVLRQFLKIEAVILRRKTQIPWFVGGTVFLFCLGCWLALIRPGQLVSKAKDNATAAIAKAEVALANGTRDLDQLKWFAPSYSSGPDSHLKQAQTLLGEGTESAKERFKSADSQSGWRAKQKVFQKAEEAASAAILAFFNSSSAARREEISENHPKANL